MIKILVFITFFTLLSASEFSAMNEACDRGVSTACYELGTIFNGEEGIKPNPEKAEYYLKKACELDHDKACKVLETLQDTLTKS